MLPDIDVVRDRIRRAVVDMNVSAVAQGAGVNQGALYRLINGQTCPRYETVQRVWDYLESRRTDGADGPIRTDGQNNG